jgi:hypothetical protein
VINGKKKRRGAIIEHVITFYDADLSAVPWFDNVLSAHLGAKPEG